MVFLFLLLLGLDSRNKLCKMIDDDSHPKKEKKETIWVLTVSWNMIWATLQWKKKENTLFSFPIHSTNHYVICLHFLSQNVKNFLSMVFYCSIQSFSLNIADIFPPYPINQLYIYLKEKIVGVEEVRKKELGSISDNLFYLFKFYTTFDLKDLCPSKMINAFFSWWSKTDWQISSELKN